MPKEIFKIKMERTCQNVLSTVVIEIEAADLILAIQKARKVLPPPWRIIIN